MRKAILYLIFFIACLLAFNIFSQGNREEKKLRFHKLLLFNNGSKIEYSIIQQQAINSKQSREDNTILLLDMGASGKWIWEKKSEQNSDGLLRHKEESFKLLESGETITIQYKWSFDKTDIEECRLTALPSGKSLSLKKDDLRNDPKVFLPFVQENFSESFVFNLEKLRQVVFYAFANNFSFEIMPYSFRTFWGKTRETDYKTDYSPEKAVQPIYLHYNCDFDAQFGYPCGKEEVPAKNPIVMITESK